jgi:CubicO group peptidase (beta-lactamase class C family)
LVGAIIEKIKGQQFEDLMHSQLFEPLEMNKARYEHKNTWGKNGILWSHKPDGRPVSRWFSPINDSPALHPAGCIRCSLGDWSRFIYHHLVGESGKSNFLAADTYIQLHRSRGDDYGLGWAIFYRDWGGDRVLQHAGSNGWNYSVMRLAPIKGFAVFVCANQGDCYITLDKIAGRLINLAKS